MIMNDTMIRGLRRKKSNKIKSFFKGMSCTKNDKMVSRNFDIDYDEEFTSYRPNNDLKNKIVKVSSKSTQTENKNQKNEITQTALDSNVRLSEYDIEYFKNLVDNNLKIHQRDILIENRRLAITRVVGIILLKINSNFNHFIAKSELKHLNQKLYNNFVRTLTRIVYYNISTNLRYFYQFSFLSDSI
eukprot:XP_764231.1 hypothetical protein [Theileria parva strain Muguga]